MPRRSGRASFRKVRLTPDETAAIRRAEEGEREEEGEAPSSSMGGTVDGSVAESCLGVALGRLEVALCAGALLLLAAFAFVSYHDARIADHVERGAHAARAAGDER